MKYIAFISFIVLLGAGCQNVEIPKKEQPLAPSVSSSTAEAPTAVLPQEEQVTKPTPNTAQASEVITYKGTWFDITYPKNFIPSPNTNVGQVDTDEARFLSPDKTVEFFVYSPQWSGEPKDYITIAPTEKMISEKTEETKATDRPGQFGDTIVRWVTVEAKDGSYSRSFVSTKKQVGTGSEVHHVFGIKYKNAAAYNTYKNAYIAFKASLKQYAD